MAKKYNYQKSVIPRALAPVGIRIQIVRFSLKIQLIGKLFQERISAPVCALVRNDIFFVHCACNETNPLFFYPIYALAYHRLAHWLTDLHIFQRYPLHKLEE